MCFIFIQLISKRHMVEQSTTQKKKMSEVKSEHFAPTLTVSEVDPRVGGRR